MASSQLGYNYVMKRVTYYIGERSILFFRDFLEHWYLRSFVNTSHYMLEFFEEIDKAFALRINLKNFFKPLYRDKTLIGYIIGFIFRSFRIVSTSILYFLIFTLSVVFYTAWLALPLYFAYKVLINYV